MDATFLMRRALAGAAVIALALGAQALPILSAQAQTPTPQPPLTVTLTPSRGPSGTSATIEITGARPGDPVTIIIGGNGVTSARADANGRATITHIFFGRPGDVVSVVAIAGTGGPADRTGASSFTITGAANRQTIALYQGMNLIPYMGPTLPVETALGPAASNISIVWQFNAAVQSWQFWTPQAATILSLQTGASYVIFARLAGEWEIPPPGWVPLNVTLSPASGPSGTTVTITVTGLEPAQVAQINIDGEVVELLGLGGGAITLTRQLSGFIGEQIVVILRGPPSAGDRFDRGAAAIFTVTGGTPTATPTATATATATATPPIVDEPG